MLTRLIIPGDHWREKTKNMGFQVVVAGHHRCAGLIWLCRGDFSGGSLFLVWGCRLGQTQAKAGDC